MESTRKRSNKTLNVAQHYQIKVLQSRYERSILHLQSSPPNRLAQLLLQCRLRKCSVGRTYIHTYKAVPNGACKECFCVLAGTHSRSQQLIHKVAPSPPTGLLEDHIS